MFFHEIQSWKNIAQCTIIAHCTLRIFLAWRTQCQFLKCTRVHNFDWIKLCHFSEKPSIEGRIPSMLFKFVFDNRTWNSSVSHTFLFCPVSLVSPEILTSKSLSGSHPIPHIVYLVHQKTFLAHSHLAYNDLS